MKVRRTDGRSKILKSAESGSETRTLNEPFQLLPTFSSKTLDPSAVDAGKEKLRRI